jgi:predicted O-methyltransferase YrrM
VLDWKSPENFEIDGVEFRAAAFEKGPTSTPNSFFLMKPRRMLEPYLELLDQESPERILELGVFKGGSTALLALTRKLGLLTAIEKSPRPLDSLARFIEDRSLSDRVRVHYGVDQGDVRLLEEIVRSDFGDSPNLDCVIDDASHDLELTRTSFSTLFPLLRPGGIYIIEDWAWGHFVFARKRDGPSLARLVVELMLTMPYAQGLVHDIVVNQFYAVVRRGDAVIEGPLQIDDCISERGHRMLSGTDA